MGNKRLCDLPLSEAVNFLIINTPILSEPYVYDAGFDMCNIGQTEADRVIRSYREYLRKTDSVVCGSSASKFISEFSVMETHALSNSPSIADTTDNAFVLDMVLHEIEKINESKTKLRSIVENKIIENGGMIVFDNTPIPVVISGYLTGHCEPVLKQYAIVNKLSVEKCGDGVCIKLHAYDGIVYTSSDVDIDFVLLAEALINKIYR